MKAVSDGIMRLAGMLDGFNQYRFHCDPELLIAWEAAKHVVSRPQSKEEEPTSPAPVAIERPAASAGLRYRKCEGATGAPVAPLLRLRRWFASDVLMSCAEQCAGYGSR